MSLHDAIFYLFNIVFFIGVILNATGPKGIRHSYQKWGLPGYFRFFTAALELLSLYLIWSGNALVGYLIALTVMGGAIFILIRNSEYKPLLAPLVTISIILYLM